MFLIQAQAGQIRGQSWPKKLLRIRIWVGRSQL